MEGSMQRRGLRWRRPLHTVSSSMLLTRSRQTESMVPSGHSLKLLGTRQSAQWGADLSEGRQGLAHGLVLARDAGSQPAVPRAQRQESAAGPPRVAAFLNSSLQGPSHPSGVSHSILQDPGPDAVPIYCWLAAGMLTDTEPRVQDHSCHDFLIHIPVQRLKV